MDQWPGYRTAAAGTNPLWLLNTLEDIMVNFEDEKKAALALDDQVERIVALKQGDSSNEDFVKLATKELKIYTKKTWECLPLGQVVKRTPQQGD